MVLAKQLVPKYFKAEGENADLDDYLNKLNETKKSSPESIIPWKIRKEFKGRDLEGIEYEQLLPFNANSLEVVRETTPGANPFRILLGDFVTREDGTGIVHTAPAFGADDFRVGKKYGIGILTMVDKEGKFVDDLGEFSNRFVKNYKDDKKTGEWTMYHTDGVTVRTKGNFENGRPKGPYVKFDETGAKKRRRKLR